MRTPTACTFAFVHGAGDGGWAWHRVEAELRDRGHATVAPDLPAGDATATLADYTATVLTAVDGIGTVDAAATEDGGATELVVVGHSFGAFTAPLVAARPPVSRLVLVAGMVPRPGEPPDQWWAATGYADAMAGRPTPDDPRDLYYHDVPRELADEALARERDHPSTAAGEGPWPLDAWPDVPTTVVVCRQDRLFPPQFLSRVVRDRLAGADPEVLELDSGHCAALARPRELADLLERGRLTLGRGLTGTSQRTCRMVAGSPADDGRARSGGRPDRGGL